jgi:hypothetical protein
MVVTSFETLGTRNVSVSDVQQAARIVMDALTLSIHFHRFDKVLPTFAEALVKVIH